MKNVKKTDRAAKQQAEASLVYVTYTRGDHAIPAGWYVERGQNIEGPFATEEEARTMAAV